MILLLLSVTDTVSVTNDFPIVPSDQRFAISSTYDIIIGESI